MLSDVSRAVGLQEGDAGVRQVLRALQRLELTSTRSVSRHTGLPVPIVAAVNNELRNRGVVTRERPSRLTPRGLALLGEDVPDLDLDPACGACDGYGLAVPPELAGLVGKLDELMSQAPPADLTLDQSHCTPETKLRRVLFLLRHQLLPSRSLLVVGDDDLMGLTVALVGAALGRPLVQRLAIVDVSRELLDFSADRLADLAVRAELVEHDLREPLPGGLAGGFELAMTDPPYTPEGARLFLSRAVEALRPGPGHAVAFSFGPKGPREALQVQRTVTELGLVAHAVERNFNEYRGAGILGGRSHLQYLGTTESTAPVVEGGYAGPMYTAEKRGADRGYLCLDCATKQVVGPGALWHTIAALKDAGCPACGGHRFRPLQLVRETPRGQ